MLRALLDAKRRLEPIGVIAEQKLPIDDDYPIQVLTVFAVARFCSLLGRRKARQDKFSCGAFHRMGAMRLALLPLRRFVTNCEQTGKWRF